MRITDGAAAPPAPVAAEPHILTPLRASLWEIRERLLAAEARHRDAVASVAPAHVESARNLIHYTALRSLDVRDVQWRLTEAGLSSLGRSEAAVLGTVEAVIDLLQRVEGRDWPPGHRRRALTPGAARALQAERTRALLAAPPDRRRAEIMVTMPSQAAAEPGLVADMVAAGLDCARINCAHDGPDEWRATIGHLRGAAAAAGRVVRIHMDLAGPKIRTGDVPVGGVRLRRGDALSLTRDLSADAPAVRDGGGRLRRPPRVGCTVPEVVERARPGHAVWFDDGRLGGVVTEAHRDALEVTITLAPSAGHALRPNKGVNVPEADLGIAALTAADLRALPFVAAHADMAGMSFVQRPEDVLALRSQLDALGGEGVATVVKVETRRAVEELPAILLAAMRGGPVGVMIARGDLAVECGWERLAEVQEEVLSLSAAAHAPVIWATQVLEGLARGGTPSRAEISDAALAERAECVMLNKGANVVGAIRMLDQILERMQRHQRKRRSLLPENVAWARFASGR